MSVPHAIPLLELIGTTRSRERRDWQHRGGGGKGKPKLSADQVRAIRADRRSPKEIAAEYGLHVNYARHVQAGETHQWVR